MQGDVRVGADEVQAGRDPAVPQRQHRLDQAGDAGGALQVADVGLDRSDEQRPVGGPDGRQGGAQRLRLDRVADAGAGAVQFHVAHVFRGDRGLPVRGPQHLGLGPRAGAGEARAAAVVVEGAAPDHAVDDVAVGACPVQGLEHHHRPALAAHVAVGAFVEGVAAAGGREAAEPGGGHGAFGEEVEVHPADERDLGLAAAQALRRQVHRDQGRGLSGVDGEARPVEAEAVGDAVGDDAAVQAGDAVGADRRHAVAVQQAGVVVPDRADEHAGRAAPQRVRDDAGVLQGLPAQFERQSLLRVHRPRLAWRDAEERGVEPVDFVQERAPAGVVLGGLLLPAALRHAPDRAAAVRQQAPERLGCGGLREPAGDPDHGYRPVAGAAVGVGHRFRHSGSHLRGHGGNERASAEGESLRAAGRGRARQAGTLAAAAERRGDGRSGRAGAIGWASPGGAPGGARALSTSAWGFRRRSGGAGPAAGRRGALVRKAGRPAGVRRRGSVSAEPAVSLRDCGHRHKPSPCRRSRPAHPAPDEHRRPCRPVGQRQATTCGTVDDQGSTYRRAERGHKPGRTPISRSAPLFRRSRGGPVGAAGTAPAGPRRPRGARKGGRVRCGSLPGPVEPTCVGQGIRCESGTDAQR